MFTTSKADFGFFRQECLLLHKRWKLTDWRLGIHHRRLAGARAHCSTIASCNIATVVLSTKWEIPITRDGLRWTARHEMAHVLTSLMDEVAQRRYVTREEREQAVETTTCKLQDILP